ncbi:DUF6477 family protein [Poseidonocella sedimentorum]|uniref:Uncharacterized protein n=1 Tax=Poseidonocella sedimentorum TaxID=871652 RepID=A0A1I6DGR2_9RHOB|nr:DUF6477 family protein [Poseidonocella sedimentorum]SFR04571.1 hypothetical protein SAMN04515673_103200 [Poseidonocella sedimentorum]
MQDVLSRLAAIRRPALLLRAARHGAARYRRDVHLARALNGLEPAKHGSAILRLLDEEDRLDELRRSGEATYSATRHVTVMIAVIAEATLLRQARQISPV